VVNSGDGIGTPAPQIDNTTFGTFGGGDGVVDSVSGPGVTKVADPMFRGISRIADGGLDPRPATGSPLLSAALTALPSSFFETANYRGAFGEKNWLDGWSWLSQKGYLPAPVDPNAPVFTTEPKSSVATLNGEVTLGSLATADGTVTYQWFRNDAPISGATSATYVINKLNNASAGTYYVEATLDGKFTNKSATATVEIARLDAGKGTANAKAGAKFKLAVTSNFKANTFKAVGLPKGLVINGKGVISGSTKNKGTFLVQIKGSRVVGGKTTVQAIINKKIKVS
jgi:hypothetical protein